MKGNAPGEPVVPSCAAAEKPSKEPHGGENRPGGAALGPRSGAAQLKLNLEQGQLKCLFDVLDAAPLLTGGDGFQIGEVREHLEHLPRTADFADCYQEAAEGYSLPITCQPTNFDLSEATRCSATYHGHVSRQQCLIDLLRSRGC